MADEKPIAGLILAAGASQRFGTSDKLLADIAGEALVCRVARRLSEAGVAQIGAVVRDRHGPVAGALRRALPDITIIENAGAERGMGTSIRCGVSALKSAAAGVLIVPGDMAFLDGGLVRAIMAAFESAGGEKIIVPQLADGVQRNPVLWPARFFPSLMTLDGESGGKALLGAHAGDIQTVTVAQAEWVLDIDTEVDLAAARKRATRLPST
jgi:molybdenum cofactor cytidylyltransferase